MTSSLASRDRALIWHPFTQEKTALPPIPILRGKGPYLYDEQGKEHLDLISSWWVNLHGHSHPEIGDAIAQQAAQLEHVIFAGFTHGPAVALCEALSALLPPPLGRFFFSDNGSTAVEVALKMAYQYWQNQGEAARTHFLSFEGGYHGDTFGAMAVGAHSGFHNTFGPLLFPVHSLPYPATWEGDTQVLEKEEACLQSLETLLQIHGSHIAALILEPLIQGASGMRACRPGFLHQVIQRVRAWNILVIFDEVMTGFGRTGTPFALSQVQAVPDFLCLSKGLSGGFLPLALTVTTAHIYEAFLDEGAEKAFLHGHSYTANPLACAAGLASLTILLRPATQQAIQAMNQTHRDALKLLQEQLPPLLRPRVVGTIGAFDVPGLGTQNTFFRKKAWEAGLLLRPLQDTLYLLPPYVLSPHDLHTAYGKIAQLLGPFLGTGSQSPPTPFFLSP